MELVQSIEGAVGKYLEEHWDDRDPEVQWQPADLLPAMDQDGWEQRVRKLRRRAEGIPDDLLVVLVGDMITEEALPTYQSWLNRFRGVEDPTGAHPRPWSRWIRSWSAEENRHGDALNRYLYLSGRVDIRAVEETIQHLIRNGWSLDDRAGQDPYVGFIYTSFQERATKISHRNVAIKARKEGDGLLQRLCGRIAGDEAQHEHAYTTFMSRVFKEDPSGAVRAFAYLMKQGVTMPAELMEDRDSQPPELFKKYSKIAQHLGVYTTRDYADIIEHLLGKWSVPDLEGLSGAAAQARDYLCELPSRYRRLAERSVDPPEYSFRWIFGRTV